MEIANEFNTYFPTIVSAFRSQTNPRVVGSKRRRIGVFYGSGSYRRRGNYSSHTKINFQKESGL